MKRPKPRLQRGSSGAVPPADDPDLPAPADGDEQAPPAAPPAAPGSRATRDRSRKKRSPKRTPTKPEDEQRTAA